MQFQLQVQTHKIYMKFVIIAASHKVYQLKDLQVYSKIWSFNNISIVNFISILSVFMPIKSPRKKSSKSRDPLNVQLVISSHKAPKIELWGSVVFYGHEIGFWTFIQPVFTNIWLFSYFLAKNSTMDPLNIHKLLRQSMLEKKYISHIFKPKHG